MATILEPSTSLASTTSQADTNGAPSPPLFISVDEELSSKWESYIGATPERFAHHGLLSHSTPAASGDHFVATQDGAIVGILSVNGDVVVLDAESPEIARGLLLEFGPSMLLGQVPKRLKEVVVDCYHTALYVESQWWIRLLSEPLDDPDPHARPLTGDDVDLIAGHLDPRYEPGWRTMLQRQPCEGFFIDGELVALAAAPYIGGGVAEVGWIRTMEPHRRHGYGKSVATALLYRLKEMGLRCAVLSVASNNSPAQALYKELGFSHTESLIRISGWRRTDLPKSQTA